MPIEEEGGGGGGGEEEEEEEEEEEVQWRWTASDYFETAINTTSQ